jgi:hypothetical protein
VVASDHVIVCLVCSRRNKSGDEFCGGCGAFLEFDGERVSDPVAPASETGDGRPPLQPGETICGACGWGNAAARRFCKHCGAPLDEAARVPAPVPWYRRFLRRPRGLAAGDRPARIRRRIAGEAGVPVRFLLAARNLLALALLATVAALALVPAVRTDVQRRVAPVVTDLRRMLLPQDSEVHPVTATATSELPGHGASMAIDSFSNTYWAADLRTGAQPMLTVRFAQPVDLYDFLFTSGVPGDYQSQARPRDVHVTFSNGTSWDLTLTDQDQPQHLTFAAKHVDRVDIQIRSVYPSASGRAVVLKKVEFFTRS